MSYVYVTYVYVTYVYVTLCICDYIPSPAHQICSTPAFNILSSGSD